MANRLRVGTTRIFECYVQVDGPSKDADSGPQIVKRLPNTYEKETLATLPKFCFPCEPDHVEPTNDPQKFTFVLTDLEGTHQFGYCRMAADYSNCLCFLSYLPWTELFYGLLDKIGSLRECGQGALEEPLLLAVYDRDLPRPGESIYVVPKGVQSGQPFQLTCPDTTKLPSIPDNWNLTEYYASISTHNILALFASMLYERRILVTSKKLSLITACIQGAALLLYPLHWQHIYIPVMPPHLCDYCCAPMPFLIGIHSSLMDRVRNMPLDEVIILDADENTVELPVVLNDLESMPEEVVRTLKHVVKKHTSGIDDTISKAFVLAFAAMIGDYRDSFKRKDGKISFDRDGFLENHPQLFFQQLMQFQHFQQFVSERLDVLNQGKGINDVFEQMVAYCKQEDSKSNISARHMAMRAAKAIPGMKNLMLQARRKAKTGMKVLKKRSKPPKGDDVWKDRTNSDSDTEPDKKQGNGFAGGIAGGIAFGNRHATMDESYHHARKRTPPAIPAPYAVYKELKSKDSQRPRSNDLTKVPSSTVIDGIQRESEPIKAHVEPLMSFTPDSSPKTTPRRQLEPVTEVADLLGLSLSNPSAQAQVLPTGLKKNPRKVSGGSLEDFSLEGDILGSFSRDLLKEFDTQQTLTRKIIVSSESSDGLVSTASSSDDEDDCEPPPIPPRPAGYDTEFHGDLTSAPRRLSATNPFYTMAMTGSQLPLTDSPFQEQLSTHHSTSTNPFAVLEAKARESRLRSLSSLFATGFDSESVSVGDISRGSSMSKMDRNVLYSQQDLDLFDPLKKSQ